MQTVWTLIRRRVLRRLIRVCTVYQLPFSGFPDKTGLKKVHFYNSHIFFFKVTQKKQHCVSKGPQTLAYNLRTFKISPIVICHFDANYNRCLDRFRQAAKIYIKHTFCPVQNLRTITYPKIVDLKENI